MNTGFGFDAGSANAAYTVAKFTKSKFQLLEVGMFESTFKNLTEETTYKKATKADRARAKKQGKRLLKTDMPSQPPFSEQYPIFHNSISTLVKDHGIDFFVGERFQTRGNSGPLIEVVGIQLGTIASLGLQLQFKTRFVIASQWKVAVNKLSDLEDLYQYASQFGFTPHECDSTGMLLYQADYLNILPLNLSLSQWRAELARYHKRS